MFKEEGVLILTPEHVQIRLVPAGLGSRFIAWFIDFVFQVGLLFILLYFFFGALGAGIGSFAFTTATFIILWGYPVYFDLRGQGRSPGKWMMGLRVVDERGLPISVPQSITRNVVRVLDSLPVFGAVGGWVAMLHPESRRLGDIAAGTLVVAETQTLDFPGRVSEGRQFNSLRNPRSMRTIRDKIGLEEREFLLALCLRAPKMDDKPRFDLMEEVGNYYREKLTIEDPHLSGENLVRGLTAIIFEKKND